MKSVKRILFLFSMVFCFTIASQALYSQSYVSPETASEILKSELDLFTGLSATVNTSDPEKLEQLQTATDEYKSLKPKYVDYLLTMVRRTYEVAQSLRYTEQKFDAQAYSGDQLNALNDVKVEIDNLLRN